MGRVVVDRKGLVFVVLGVDLRVVEVFIGVRFVFG